MPENRRQCNIHLGPALARDVEAYRLAWAARAAADPDSTGKEPTTGDVIRRALRMLLAAEREAAEGGAA